MTSEGSGEPMAGRSSSIGSVSTWHASGPSSIPISGTFFRGDLVMKNSYGHSPSSADSRRAVVSYWQKNVHYILVNCLGGLPRNSVVRVTDQISRKPAYPHSLTRAFAVRQSLCSSHTRSMEVDKGSNQKSDIYPHWRTVHACKHV